MAFEITGEMIKGGGDSSEEEAAAWMMFGERRKRLITLKRKFTVNNGFLNPCKELKEDREFCPERS